MRGEVICEGDPLSEWLPRVLPPFSALIRKDKEKDDPRFRVTILYIQGVSEAVTRILSNIDVQVHMKPFRTPRRILSHPKDCIPDGDKSSIVYKINCHDCDASCVGEHLMSEHCRAVDKMDSALAQHAWEHDHHINWRSTCVLETESQLHPWQPSSLRSTLPDVYEPIIL